MKNSRMFVLAEGEIIGFDEAVNGSAGQWVKNT